MINTNHFPKEKNHGLNPILLPLSSMTEGELWVESVPLSSLLTTLGVVASGNFLAGLTLGFRIWGLTLDGSRSVVLWISDFSWSIWLSNAYRRNETITIKILPKRSKGLFYSCNNIVCPTSICFLRASSLFFRMSFLLFFLSFFNLSAWIFLRFSSSVRALTRPSKSLRSDCVSV